MLLQFDDDQRFWQEIVRDAVGRQCTFKMVRDVAEGSADAVALWRFYLDQGWTGLTPPGTFVELAIVLEELGRAADPTPFLATTTQFAPLAGERFDPTVSGAAVYEGVSAHREAVEWVLSGAARYVPNGADADRLAVVTPAGVFVIDADQVIRRRVPTFDPLLATAHLLFDGVRVGDGDRITVDIERARHIALTGLAIHMVGACQRILELTVEHVKERHQFGVPIGSFQAIQHKVTDMHVAIERARALAYFAAATIVSDDPRRRVASAMAKAAAGEAQSLVVQHGLQCFGAMGVTWENDVQFVVKRAKAGELLLGSAEEHRAAIAEEYRAAQF